MYTSLKYLDYYLQLFCGVFTWKREYLVRDVSNLVMYLLVTEEFSVVLN